MMEFPNFMLPPIEQGKSMNTIVNRPRFAGTERQHFPPFPPLTSEEPNGGIGRQEVTLFPEERACQRLVFMNLS